MGLEHELRSAPVFVHVHVCITLKHVSIKKYMKGETYGWHDTAKMFTKKCSRDSRQGAFPFFLVSVFVYKKCRDVP